MLTINIRKEVKMKIKVCLLLLLLVGSVWGCATPYYVWPQKDIDVIEINPSALDTRILIASRKSEFKNAVIEKIKAAFLDKPVYLKITGLDNLVNEDAAAFSAVLLVNTSMAWDIDPKVKTFLDKFKAQDNIIILTTSDSGDIYPDLADRDIDAIATASTDDAITPVADDVIAKLNKIIETQEG